MEETYGVRFPNGESIEYIFDPSTGKASLVTMHYGKVVSGETIERDGITYKAAEPGFIIRNGIIKSASGLGKLVSTDVLLSQIEAFYAKYFFFTIPEQRMFLAQYSLYTWQADIFGTCFYVDIDGYAGSGKTRLSELLGLIVYRPIFAEGGHSERRVMKAVDKYKATVIFDDVINPEIDQEYLKVLNLGATRSNWLFKVVQKIFGNRKTYESKAFSVFGPKIILSRRFKLGGSVQTRSVILNLNPVKMIDLQRAEIPFILPPEAHKEAQEIRNNILTWRIWHPVSLNGELSPLNVGNERIGYFGAMVAASLGESVFGRVFHVFKYIAKAGGK
jgi:hypothetical protein